MNKPFETPMMGWPHGTKPVEPPEKPAYLTDPAEWALPGFLDQHIVDRPARPGDCVVTDVSPDLTGFAQYEDARPTGPVTVTPKDLSEKSLEDVTLEIAALAKDQAEVIAITEAALEEMISQINGAHLPETVGELIAWFESEFTCFQGPPRAYFEIPAPDGSMNRYVFTTYAYATRNSDYHPGKAAERTLVQMLHAAFSPLTQDLRFEGTALFWRMPEKISLTYEQVPVLGELIATQMEVEDGLKLKPAVTALQDESGNWRHLLGWQDKWTLRTRLCIPMLDISGKSVGRAHHEGAQIMEV